MLDIFFQGGLHVLIMFDSYVATWGPLWAGMLTCVALSWVYGIDYFCSNIRAMLGHTPSLWWQIMWKFVTPGLLLVSTFCVCGDGGGGNCG